MIYTSSERLEESARVDGTVTVGSTDVAAMSAGRALDGA